MSQYYPQITRLEYKSSQEYIMQCTHFVEAVNIDKKGKIYGGCASKALLFLLSRFCKKIQKICGLGRPASTCLVKTIKRKWGLYKVHQI